MTMITMITTAVMTMLMRPLFSDLVLSFLALASLADMERNLMSRMHAQDKNRFRAVGLSSVLLLVSE